MTDNDTPWVHEMVLIHRVFRREFTLAPELVLSIGPLDRRGVARVAGHLRFVLLGLHVHHSGEDELLWPLLTKRAQLAAALMARMQSQHDDLSLATSEVQELLSGWPVSADPTAAAALVAALARLRELLIAHLDEEEQRVLPLVTTYIAPVEWGRLAEHGFAHMPKSVLFRQLGAILEDADPTERRDFLASVPPPVRVLWRAVGHRRYARYIGQIRRGIKIGTRT
jgi:hemerythrin-like domain-containing protein